MHPIRPTNTRRPSSYRIESSPRGFALVISLTLMVLLTVVAVGLLTLSSISLRSSSQGEAMQMARSNARMALSLAIGQLQKSVGPDQRITAPANLLSPQAHPGLTGAWESAKLSPDGDPGLQEAKKGSRQNDAANGEFIGWLASQSWGASTQAPATPPTPAAGGRTATLLNPLSAASSGTPLEMDILPVSDTGGIAWTSIDESVKARFDLPVDNSGLTAEARKARLRAPARSAPEVIEGLGDFELDQETAAKMASYRQGEFFGGDKQAFLAQHDALTPWSLSLPVNVADGGLKADLTRAFESAALPPELAGRYLYSGLKTPLTPADPLFSNLGAYYQLYASSAGGTRPLTSAVPKNYRPTVYDARTSASVPNLASLDGNVVAPVVTKVQVAFSLVSREAHGQWRQTIPDRTSDPLRTFMVYLIYTPVVTLYNPYNAPINVNALKVTFKHLPLAFQFFRNGVAQNTSPALLSQFHISSENRTDWEDQFTSTLSNTAGSSSANLLLQPGEAKVFGVNHPRGTTWSGMTNYLWQNDLASSKTLNLFAGPGWNFRSGFKVFYTSGSTPLNPRLTPRSPGGIAPENAATLAVSESAWTSNAASQWIKGSFNVNSTSVAAWKAMLASLGDASIPVLDPTSSKESEVDPTGYPMPRNLRGLAGRISGGDTNQNRWAGFRDLEEKQLQTLAEEIVEQVRLRGPFASMSEFVNRRLTSEGDKASGAGTLEMAIRETDINSNSRAANPRMVTAADTADFGYANVTAALGDTEEGANSFLTQGDLLEALGASLTVRSDTFVVRAYGDTKDAKGNIIAKAVCEAVVQRVAPFVDSTDAPEKVQAALGDQARAIGSLTELNRRFGRRFEVVSMRWLSPEEV